ncbi:hypothetical protein AGIG_G23866 [Arapaima gigas]
MCWDHRATRGGVPGPSQRIRLTGGSGVTSCGIEFSQLCPSLVCGDHPRSAQLLIPAVRLLADSPCHADPVDTEAASHCLNSK